jgi:hypothetical protein
VGGERMLSATEMAVLNGHEMVLTYISRTKRKNRVVSFLLSNIKRSYSILKINKMELIEKEKNACFNYSVPSPIIILHVVKMTNGLMGWELEWLLMPTNG